MFQQIRRCDAPSKIGPGALRRLIPRPLDDEVQSTRRAATCPRAGA